MSATSRRETSPAAEKMPVATSGSSVWTWTRSVTWSPTTSTESPIASSSVTYESASASSPSPTAVTAKFVQKRNVEDSCSGCVICAGAWWWATSGGASPRSAATHPANSTTTP